MPKILVAAEASSAHVQSTAAANLAVALAALAARVELLDREPARRATRALVGLPGSSDGPSDGPSMRAAWPSIDDAPIPSRLSVTADPRSAWRAEPVGEPTGPDVGAVVVVECGSGDCVASAPAGEGSADLLLLPVDASSRALDRLDALVARLASSAIERPPLLRVVVSRVLPRAVDRWALVERVAERVAERSTGALYGVTVPMGRGGRASGAAATMYSPSGRAGAAYRALARLVLADLADLANLADASARGA